MPSLHLGDIDLYYETHGLAAAPDGPTPLVLVAGLASDSQSWLTVLPALAERRPVVVFDNRGCGRTTPQGGANGIDRMAADCIALADHLRLGRFDLIGHSMGGYVALDCALAQPERVRRLVLANTAATSPARNDSLFADWAAGLTEGTDAARWFRTFFYWIFTPGFFQDPKAVADLLRLALDYPYPQSAAGFAGQTRALRGFDRRAALAGLRTETLVLASGSDLIFPPGDDAAGLAAIPGARVVVVPELAHALHVEAPGRFLDPVEAFLGGL
jgi:pimeloyl-ACP methyl ester carboxylesterase